jgi:hypothetical protein
LKAVSHKNQINQYDLLTGSISLIERLASSSSTSGAVNGLATLLLGGAEANGVLDAFHVCIV